MTRTWRERIVEARERGGFTTFDVDDAQSWTTCAVGEQHAAMPLVIVYGLICDCERDACPHQEAPVDVALVVPGTNFFHAVRTDEFTAADALLDAIEDRALELKRAATS